MTWADSSEPYLKPQDGGVPDVWTQQAGAAQRIVNAGETVAPADVATALNIAPWTPAVVRRRLLALDGRPYEVAASWWPTDIGANTALAEPRRIKGGAVTLLAELGYIVRRTVEEVWAAAASAEDADLLDIESGSPVLVLFRTAFDARDVPFQVDVMTRRAYARQRYQLTAN